MLSVLPSHCQAPLGRRYLQLSLIGNHNQQGISGHKFLVSINSNKKERSYCYYYYGEMSGLVGNSTSTNTANLVWRVKTGGSDGGEGGYNNLRASPGAISSKKGEFISGTGPGVRRIGGVGLVLSGEWSAGGSRGVQCSWWLVVVGGGGLWSTRCIFYSTSCDD